MDIASYILGTEDGRKNVVIEGSVTCTDDGQGNVVINEEAK